MQVNENKFGILSCCVPVVGRAWGQLCLVVGLLSMAEKTWELCHVVSVTQCWTFWCESLPNSAWLKMMDSTQRSESITLSPLLRLALGFTMALQETLVRVGRSTQAQP